MPHVYVHKKKGTLEVDSSLRSSFWASEASPTLGFSIEILRDIYSYMYIIYMLSVCRSMSVICQINCVGGMTCCPRACSKSFLGGG